MDFAPFGTSEWRFGRFCAESASFCELPSHQEQVTEGEEREEMRAVLLQSPLAGFYVAELALDNQERMLNPGPHLRIDPLDLLIQLTALWEPCA